MHEETVGSKIVKWVLIGVSVLFLVRTHLTILDRKSTRLNSSHVT